MLNEDKVSGLAVSSDRFYRGADLRSLNQNEFADNAVTGHTVHVTEVDGPGDADDRDWQAKATDSFSEYIVDDREVAITGGLTDQLSAAVKFTKNTDPPGVVLHINAERLGAEVTPVEYDIGWFDDHPGALAHVDTLNDGELREDGRIIGLLDDNDDDWYVREYGRDRAVSRADSPTYESESESVAFTDEIPLRQSVTNLVTYAGTTGVSPYTLSEYAESITAYTGYVGDLRNRDADPALVGGDDYRTQAELVYDAMVDMIQYDTSDYHIVAVESMNDVRGGQIDPDNFRFVYNGRGFDTSYERNSNLLGGS